MIIFRNIRFKNFRSYGNQFTDVRLDKSKTTAITATNGMGKTSILLAIEFALFGKVAGGINKPELINNVNNRDCLCECEFDVNSKHYMVRRGIKPTIFEILENGNLLNQDSSSKDYQKILEEEILGFNLNSFKQVVSISGTGYSPFMLLPAAMRRKITDDLLGISVLSEMVKLHKINVDNHNENIKKIESGVAQCDSRIKGLKAGLDKLVKKDEDAIKQIDFEIEAITNQIVSINDEIGSYIEKLNSLGDPTEKIESIDKKSQELRSYRSDIEKKNKNLSASIKIINDKTSCPTCCRDVDEEFKKNFVSERQSKIDTNNKNLELLGNKIDEIQNQITSFKKVVSEIDSINKKMIALNTQINEKNRSLVELNRKKNAVPEGDDDLINQIKEASDILDKLKAKKVSLLVTSQYNDIVSAIIKDTGIRAMVIKKYIPLINSTINKFLGYMDLNVNFTFDGNFNETILSRFRDNLSYTSFSAGERARIDVALLMTWREIARAKNSLKCNLLFLDEVFDGYFDQTGLETFINLLSNLEDTNVFMISHRPETVDKFQSNLRITKQGNFSKIEF